MLNRLSVSALLKTVILATSFVVVVGFSLNAWDSWGRLQTASRISVITDASANMFKAMHNLRTDQRSQIFLDVGVHRRAAVEQAVGRGARL